MLASFATLGVVAAYSLMIHFFRMEGRRYFAIRTEMALAGEIHGALVPACSLNAGGFEIYGASVPSGGVGGDLVDVVTLPEGWIGYVADVSGHGVQSGVLVAMFKTALRAQIPNWGPPGAGAGGGASNVVPAQAAEHVYNRRDFAQRRVREGYLCLSGAPADSAISQEERAGERAYGRGSAAGNYEGTRVFRVGDAV